MQTVTELPAHLLYRSRARHATLFDFIEKQPLGTWIRVNIRDDNNEAYTDKKDFNRALSSVRAAVAGYAHSRIRNGEPIGYKTHASFAESAMYARLSVQG